MGTYGDGRGIKPVFARLVFARARRFCLALPEVQETTSSGIRRFRVSNTTFCTFETIGYRGYIAFRLTPEEVEAVLRRDGFFAPPHGGGCWVGRWVNNAMNWPEVQRLIERSYRQLAGTRLVAVLDNLPSGPT